MALRTAVRVHVAVYLVPHWVSIHESGVGMRIGAYPLTQLKKKKKEVNFLDLCCLAFND